MPNFRFITQVIITLVILIISKTAYTAPSNYSIMAVVNGDPITALELNERMDVMVASANLQDSVRLRKQLSRQAIQILINELLQSQEGKKSNILASPDDVTFAISGIENANNLQKGEFSSFAAQQGLTKESLVAQISAQIVWKKIISRILVPKIHVSDFEIEDNLKQLTAQNIIEVYLSEILLPIIGNDEKNTLATASDLIEQISKGANFSDIAEQFSQGSTAKEGGVIGWIPQKQLNGKLKQAVTSAEPNSILPAIISEDGVRIVKVGNRRSNSINRDKEKIRNRITQQKIELESKRFMKDLRGKSFIELRF